MIPICALTGASAAAYILIVFGVIALLAWAASSIVDWIFPHCREDDDVTDHKCFLSLGGPCTAPDTHAEAEV